jgi:y4mF family transcriptional regulator
MHVRTAHDLGAAIRGERRRRGLTQAQLAAAVGVTRAWVIAMEQGKPGAELTLVLRTLAALDLVADLVPAPPAHGGIDLDELLGDSHA